MWSQPAWAPFLSGSVLAPCLTSRELHSLPEHLEPFTNTPGQVGFTSARRLSPGWSDDVASSASETDGCVGCSARSCPCGPCLCAPCSPTVMLIPSLQLPFPNLGLRAQQGTSCFTAGVCSPLPPAVSEICFQHCSPLNRGQADPEAGQVKPELRKSEEGMIRNSQG